MKRRGFFPALGAVAGVTIETKMAKAILPLPKTAKAIPVPPPPKTPSHVDQRQYIDTHMDHQQYIYTVPWITSYWM